MLPGKKRYLDGVEKSAEYLRQALPLMSQQSAGLHPVSYAIWYEYVSGANPALRAAIEEELKKGTVLNETLTDSLYRRFVAEIDEEQAERISSGFNRVFTDINRSASQAGEQAGKFGHTLERWSENLNDHQEVARGIDELLGDTRIMQSNVALLQQQLLASQKEIENLKQEVSRARQDALLDSLTGLANRRGFEQALSVCLDGVNCSNVPAPCMLMADIDHFKRVNDTYGHIFGDKVIRAVGQILHQSIKGKDMAARYGGEEFVILLPDTPLQGAQMLAESIRTTIEKGRIKRGDAEKSLAQVTISLGVANYRRGESASEFITRADQALYASKEQGRNRVSLAV